MKIKTKLSLLYTSITVGILTIVFIFVYFVTSKNIDANYDSLLFDKALVTAQKHFERDELNQQAYEKILDAYQSLLPETSETVIVANNKQEAIAELQPILEENKIQELFYKHKVRFKLDDLSGVAIYYPDNEGNFIVMVTAKNVQGEYLKGMLRNILIAVLIISSILIFGLLWWNSQMITKPLQEMVDQMKKITSKDLHLRLAERKGNDELAQTINYFNRMIERLERSFNSQKTFIANASHELKNPLTAIMGECEVMQLKEFTPEEYKKSIQRIESEIIRLSTLVSDILRLAQTDLDISESGAEQLDIVGELASVVQYFEHSGYKGRVLLENEKRPFFIKSNKHLFFVALQNIIDNACKYSDGTVFVKAIQTGQQFKISFTDHGIGIPEEEKDKIFDTFYRAKNTHNVKGAGIGLSLTHKILTLSGAEIQINSKENQGTTISVMWYSNAILIPS